MRYLTDESYFRIVAELIAQQEGIWVEEGQGRVDPNEIDIAQALKDATLPELESIIRHMNQAAATLDFESLGEDYVYLFQNALESLKTMYENLYAEQNVPVAPSEQAIL